MREVPLKLPSSKTLDRGCTNRVLHSSGSKSAAADTLTQLGSQSDVALELATEDAPISDVWGLRPTRRLPLRCYLALLHTPDTTLWPCHAAKRTLQPGSRLL